jgi:aryl-alcohol dehydrogenase-like predicted oxidoreductase
MEGMDYTRLGTSGLQVSRIALGCMSFGKAGSGSDWALDTDGAEPIFRQAVELGITFWDTANVYSAGTSEEITGDAIAKYTSREQVVLATKLFAPPTTSTCTRSTASTRRPPWRRRWRHCTTS